MPVTIERIEKTSGVQVQNRAWLKDVYCIYKQVRTRSKSIFYGFTHVCFSDEVLCKIYGKSCIFITIQVERTGTTGVAKKFRQQGGTLEMSIARKA